MNKSRLVPSNFALDETLVKRYKAHGKFKAGDRKSVKRRVNRRERVAAAKLIQDSRD